MAYHMPRVAYWVEQASVRFFPTPYLNQIMLQPMAEYAALQTYVLSGGDRWVNFGQWFASAGSTLGVSLIARELGAGVRGQAAAALFCATLPSGILASTGAKNDYWLAMWLVAAVYFALRYAQTMRLADAAWMGGALGLALLTKATAYLFAPWPLAAILVWRARKSWRRTLVGVALALGVACALNLAQYARNDGLSGSVLGFDSAQGNGVFRWRNETFGWKETASNALRHFSEQMGARSERWNRSVYDFVVAAHRWLRIDANDPRTTWPGGVYEPPRNANHEANAPNRWHLALLLIVGCVLAARTRRDSQWALYAASLALGFVAYCAYLKWQPFSARLFLPLFVLAAPLAAFAVEKTKPALPWMSLALCFFFVNNARPALFENWTRPLKGPHSVLNTPRDEQYFADMGQWGNRESYLRALEILAGSRCDLVGIDINNLQLEYPLQALLRERRPGVKFVHTGVANVSQRYAPPVAGRPCAVVCLDCAGDEKRLGLYGDYGTGVPVGKFVVFKR